MAGSTRLHDVSLSGILDMSHNPIQNVNYIKFKNHTAEELYENQQTYRTYDNSFMFLESIISGDNSGTPNMFSSAAYLQLYGIYDNNYQGINFTYDLSNGKSSEITYDISESRFILEDILVDTRIGNSNLKAGDIFCNQILDVSSIQFSNHIVNYTEDKNSASIEIGNLDTTTNDFCGNRIHVGRSNYNIFIGYNAGSSDISANTIAIGR